MAAFKPLSDPGTGPGLLSSHPETAAVSLTGRNAPTLSLAPLPGPGLRSEVAEPESNRRGGGDDTRPAAWR